METATKVEPTQVDEFQARVIAARYGDMTTYARAVHDLTLEPYQAAWEEALKTLTRIVIICPPDTFKSTTVRLFVEKLIGTDPSIKVLWLMGTSAQSTKQVMDVGATIKNNPIYREAFGILPDAEKQWTNQVLFVKNDRFGPDPTLMSTGINGPYQGLHFDVIVVDDPTTPQDVRSPTEMELQEHMMRGMILDRLAEGGRIIVILTRWGENDLVPVFRDMGFDIITMPVIGDYPWGPTLSNKLFPMERVEEIRREKLDALFSLTFMCSPESVRGNLIQRENFRYWDDDTLPEAALQLFMGIDPAASQKTYADHTCIAVVGLDTKTRKKYLTDMITRRMETPDLEDLVVKLAKRMSGLRRVAFETKGFQLSLVQGIQRRYQIQIDEIPYRTRRNVARKVRGMDNDKVGRALYLNSEFAHGMLYLPRNLPLVEGVSLEQELCAFPHGKHDDRLDALTIACTMADTACPARGMKVDLKAGW